MRHSPLPTADEVRRYYEKAYRLDYKKNLTPKLKHVYRAGLVALQRVQAMNTWLTETQTVLDIGAGGGELCYMMQAGDRCVTGLEPNHGYALYAREQLGLNISIGDYQTAPIAAETFDLITMFHVLEHILEPLEILHKARGWLRSGGHLIVEVPNVEALCVSPKNRFHFAHIYNFNLATLEALGMRAGFAIRNRFVADDGGIIRVIFQKTTAPQKMTLDLSANSKKIQRLLLQHTPLAHLFSHYPYTRFLKKLARGFNEWLVTRKHDTGEGLLKRMKNTRSTSAANHAR